MSSICSIPTLSRIVSGLTPALRCSSADICRWVVEAGMASQRFGVAQIDQPLDQLQRIVEVLGGFKPPFTPKVIKEQARPPRYFCASA